MLRRSRRCIVMGLILFLLFAVPIALLWRRVDVLERQIALLEGGARVPAAAPAAEPVAAEPLAVPVAELAPPPAVAPTRAGEIAATTARWRPRFDFEDLFGRMLPIWAGGVTLAVAGFFLVRWSIDAGLLTPRVRVVLAGLFGIALIAGAEVAYRWRERVADPRVAQALAGAGLATLYAAFYLAGSAYGLIGSTLAFIGLAAVTAAAIGLSYRFGLPSAVLGLVGGFSAPALVGSEQANLPLLTLYLALVTAGLALTGRRQDRAWLGVAALAGGLGWGALLLAGGAVRTPDIAVLGGYLVLLGAVLPALSGGVGRPHWLVRVGAAALAALQLAVLVSQGGFGPLEWSLYLLLGAALAWFGWRQPAMREGNAVAAAVGVALLASWSTPSSADFTLVGAALAVIFAGVPLAQLWRGHGRPIDIAQASGAALGLGLAALWRFGSALPERSEPGMALALFALGCVATATVALARFSPEARRDPWPVAAQAIAALLGLGALAQVMPQDALAWTAAAAAAALLAWRWRNLTGAIATLALITACWALSPVFDWLAAGMLALSGPPMTLAELPALREVALHLLPAIIAAAAWSVAAPAAWEARRALVALAVGIAAIAGHIVFRHAFAAIAGEDFVATGVIERAVWEALLLGAAWFAWSRGWRKVAGGLAAAALAHFAWFALVLHNPLWAQQAVGPVPLANALLPAYAAGFAGLALLRRLTPPELTSARWLLHGATMAVAALLALSELRQVFAGTLLTAAPVGQGEDLLRSLLGIVLAIGFLLWGARTHERSWRIGSLVLMVIAVLKVFLIDAAGLAGLARIASFMALGFSLIGIGWFYARQLRPMAAGSAGEPSEAH
jgi:uncharacterized membrane protein